MLRKRVIVGISVAVVVALISVPYTYEKYDQYNTVAQNVPKLKTGQSADVIDAGFGEYLFSGNTWIEIGHSATNPVPWKTEFDSNYNRISSTERKNIELFYERFDIRVLDVIKYDWSTVCTGMNCIIKTYYILVSDDDYEKFRQIS